MQCIFLFRDANGRLPTVGELMARGFVISAAVEPPVAAAETVRETTPGRAKETLALAAEPRSSYGAEPRSSLGAEPGAPAGAGTEDPPGRA